MKTPLSSIEGYATLLQSDDISDKDRKEYSMFIFESAKKLSALTSNILKLSKLENQEIPTNRSEFLVDEQIRHSLVALESQWDSKDIGLDVELCEAKYYGNELLMRHVWDNLISNALKFPKCA